jgi:DNA-binding CsgD family transcriptional regulator
LKGFSELLVVDAVMRAASSFKSIPVGYTRTEMVNECWLHIPSFVDSHDAEKGLNLIDWVYHKSRLRMRDIMSRWHKSKHTTRRVDAELSDMGQERHDDLGAASRLTSATRHLSPASKELVQILLAGDLSFTSNREILMIARIRSELGLTAPDRTNRDLLLEMAADGKTEKQISETLGVTLKKVHSITAKRKKKKNPM